MNTLSIVRTWGRLWALGLTKLMAEINGHKYAISILKINKLIDLHRNRGIIGRKSQIKKGKLQLYWKGGCIHDRDSHLQQFFRFLCSISIKIFHWKSFNHWSRRSKFTNKMINPLTIEADDDFLEENPSKFNFFRFLVIGWTIYARMFNKLAIRVLQFGGFRKIRSCLKLGVEILDFLGY